jgi:hypothetical protein
MAESLEELAVEVLAGTTSVEAAVARIQEEAREDAVAARQALAFALGAETIDGIEDAFTPTGIPELDG